MYTCALVIIACRTASATRAVLGFDFEYSCNKYDNRIPSLSNQDASAIFTIQS